MRRLLIFLAGFLALALAQNTHTVQRGETLFGIAQRYGTTVQTLADLNGLADPTKISVGQVLRLPSATSSRPQPIPTDPTVRRAVSAPFGWVEMPASVIQGRAFVVRIGAQSRGEVRFRNVAFPIREGRAIVATPALLEPGRYPLAVLASGSRVDLSLEVRAGRFGRFYLDLPPERAALLVPERLRAERLKVVGVCDPERERIWSGNFRRPVASTRITDPFGTRRSYEGGPWTYHEGTDYGIPVGTPVYAPAPGVVTLAEPLFVRGNGVVIDHGQRVCSGFWHLSRIMVTPGQRVEAGDLIAYSGNTGLSNGPHLHWEIRVVGVPVDPQPWLTRAP